MSVAPSVSFVSEKDGQIDGQPAKFIEAKLNQQNIEFRVLMALVFKGDKYFIISSNTTSEEWPKYQDVFYSVANSFKFK